ncbi:TSUP family transporter [Ramlibacter sp. MMS24-I3-19]|uniref:TSUP family transporter n=1 Tax=Ramlibacter sp. MMS24-I3-19 TaxID=3416606 RepID=UPI003D04C1AD
MTAWQLCAFLLCVAVATGAQSITGFAMALILLGLCGLLDVAPLAEVANVATVLSLVSAAVALRSSRRSIDWPMLRMTGSGSVIGVALGVFLLAWLQSNIVMVLRLLLGVTVVACALVVLFRAEPLARRSPGWTFGLFGALSGVLGGLFSASGPPLVYQYYRQPLELESLRDTLVAALAVSSALRLSLVVASGQFSARAMGLCAVATPLAAAITWWMRRHPPPWPRRAVLVLVCALLLATGAGLIVPSVRSLARTIGG